MSHLYVGLISGTSVDAVDAALVEVIANDNVSTLACHKHPITQSLRDSLLGAFSHDSLQTTLELDVRLGHLFAEAVMDLLDKAGLTPSDVRAIGSHGQTISHKPSGPHPHTLQIGDPNIIAVRTGITTVADFRRRDVALGGQGAPLAPAFHAALFGGSDQRRAVVNIGGIANLTLLPKHHSDDVIGFDTGPGNGLLDAWVSRHLEIPMDTDAVWASAGTVDKRLLGQFLSDEYFARPAPKSTGKEYFDLRWVDQVLARNETRVDKQDVQRTLAELTISTIAEAVRDNKAGCDELLVCGGGAQNPLLMGGLREKLSPMEVKSTAEYGVDPDYLEACAFAWLAKQTLEGTAGNLPSVTGARKPVVLGGVYFSN